MVVTFLAPESPWWYMRHGHHDRARNSLRRLARREGFDQRDEDRTMARKLDLQPQLIIRYKRADPA